MRQPGEDSRNAQEGGFEEKNVKNPVRPRTRLGRNQCHMRTKIKTILFYERKKKTKGKRRDEEYFS